ncbi:MAG: hypothetical protein QG556_1140 [Pseudomonadota bacterium]|nr:hypothetical protein [Pseudomonadota bacterium]
MPVITLEDAIAKAIAEEGQQTVANQAYFSFLKSSLLMPIEKGSGEEPRVLFLDSNDHVFLPVFSQKSFLIDWAADSIKQIDIYELSCMELLAGLGEQVTVALNPGTSIYKEFNPDEILKLKTMVSKIQQLVQGD